MSMTPQKAFLDRSQLQPVNVKPRAMTANVVGVRREVVVPSKMADTLARLAPKVVAVVNTNSRIRPMFSAINEPKVVPTGNSEGLWGSNRLDPTVLHPSSLRRMLPLSKHNL